MLSKAFVYLPFTHGFAAGAARVGFSLFLLVCEKHRHFMFIIIEFFSAKLKTYIEMAYSPGTKFRHFTICK